MSLWQRWVELENEILLLEIKQDAVKHILVVEGHHDFSPNTIYIPQRFMNDYKRFEIAEVKVLQEIPPIATSIKLHILEQEFEGFDIVTAVSEYLSHWNILSKGAIISVPCSELGGFPVEILVTDTKPEDIVLLRGEVPLELEEHDPSPPQSPVIVPQQSSNIHDSSVIVPPDVIDEFSDILPNSNTLIQNLASDRHYRNSSNKPSFTPFSGTGYRLGS